MTEGDVVQGEVDCRAMGKVGDDHCVCGIREWMNGWFGLE